MGERKKFDPSMCRNCSHEKINHLDCEDTTACLLCEPCEAYQPLGEELARKMNAGGAREFPAVRDA